MNKKELLVLLGIYIAALFITNAPMFCFGVACVGLYLKIYYKK